MQARVIWTPEWTWLFSVRSATYYETNEQNKLRNLLFVPSLKNAKTDFVLNHGFELNGEVDKKYILPKPSGSSSTIGLNVTKIFKGSSKPVHTYLPTYDVHNMFLF